MQETKNNLADEILNIKNQGQVILNCFREEGNDLPHIQQILHIQEVQRYCGVVSLCITTPHAY